MLGVEGNIELLQRFRRGDEGAAQELLDRYFPLVYRFCESRRAHALEDVMLRTFRVCHDERAEPEREGLRHYLLELAGHQLDNEHGVTSARAASTAAFTVSTAESEPSAGDANAARATSPTNTTSTASDVFHDLVENVAKARVEAALCQGRSRRARLGSFDLIRTLGRGGMGMVFEALDPQSGEPVALKTVKRRDALSLIQLKREFRTRRQLIHPNVVGFRELYVDGPVWFFSMELIRGTDLLSHVRPAGKLDLARLRNALAQLFHGIEALHAAAMVHNDLTPSNVLVDADGTVVVLDFGLAARLNTDGAAAEHVGGGTPGYVAPERIAGAPPSAASDFYALGALLFYMLTGSPPRALAEPFARPHAGPHAWPDGSTCDLQALCTALLHPDPAQRPNADTVRNALCNASSGDAAPAPDPRSRARAAVFVGRDAELAQLETALALTRNGRPAAVLIEGESGLGKTRLIERFASLTRAHALVLSSRCSEHEQVPFKAVDGIIDALCWHIAHATPAASYELAPDVASVLVRTFPVLSHALGAVARASDGAGAGMVELRSRAFAGLKELLRQVTQVTPLILAIDDLQWADLDSARLLADVIAPPNAPALLLVGSFRPGEGAFLSELAQRVANIPGAPRFTRIALSALSVAEATALATRLLNEAASEGELAQRESVAAAVARESEGNPLWVSELARHVLSGAQAGARAASIDESIAARIERLPQPAQRLLQALAIADRPTSAAVAAQAADLQEHAASWLQRLEAESLVRLQRRDAFQPYHDRVRELVVERMSALEQRGYHARLARALQETERGEPEWLAHHYTAAGERATAAGYCVTAADRAFSQLAFHRASELFGAALQLIGEADPRRGELERRRADALALAGHGAAAAQSYERAATDLPPAAAGALLRLAAAQWLRAGHKEQGLARVEQLLREVGVAWPRNATVAVARLVALKLQLRLRGLEYRPRLPADIAPAARARLETIAAICGEVSMVDSLRGAWLQTQLLLLALDHGDPLHVAQGYAWEAMNTAWLGGPGQARRACDLVARSQALAARLDSPHTSGISKLAEAGCHLFAGRHHAVRAPALEAERVFRKHCAGAWWESQLVVSMRYSTLERTGELLELANEAPAQLQDAYEKDDRFSKGQLALFAPLVHMMHDDPGAALRMLDEQRGHAHGAFDTIQLWILYRTVDANMYAGHVDEAVRYLERELARLQRSSLFRTKFVRLGTHFLHGKCSIGAATRYPELLREAERSARMLERMGRTDADCYALVLRAGIAARSGDRARAAELCRRAERACRAAHIGHYAWLAARNLARVSDRVHEHSAGRVAEASMLAQGIENLERWSATFAPGFDQLY